MAAINLHYVDELIRVRQDQHGGLPGAPIIEQGHRAGASLNRSCVVMLSALMQAFVEEVFQDAAKARFSKLAQDPDAFSAYWKQMKNWGNPSDSNIKNLFLTLGIPDVLVGLTWQRTNSAAIKKNLYVMNHIRNQIAHGAKALTVDKQPYSLTLRNVVAFRNFSESFGHRFVGQVEALNS